jgi:phosphatidate phosphatase APP1
MTMDPGESLDSGLSSVNYSALSPLAVPGILGYALTVNALTTVAGASVGTTLAVGSTSTFTGLATFNGNIHGTLDATSVLANGVTGTTQSALNNSTKVATTAYVDSAVTAAAQPWSIFISAQISGTSVNHQLHEGNTISGVTNGSTGIYVVSFTSNFAAATYGIQVTAQSAGDPCYAFVAAQAVGSCTIHIVDTSSDALVNNPFTITVTY